MTGKKDWSPITSGVPKVEKGVVPVLLRGDPPKVVLGYRRKLSAELI